MKKQAKTKSFSALALERTKKTFAKKSTILAALVLMCMISLALALLSPITLFLTLPLLVFPSIFAFISVNAALEENIPSGAMSFFLLYRTYFTVNFVGCFKLIIGFLKAILCFFILTVICSIIGTFFIQNIDPQIIDTLISITEIEDELKFAEEFANFLNSGNSFATIVEVTSYVSFGGAYLLFVHHTMINGIKYYMNLLSRTPIFARDLNTIFGVTFKKIKKQFYKDYYKSVWLLPIVLALGFAGGICLGKFVFNLDIALNIVIGWFGSFILILPFIPYYFDLTLIIFKKYQPTFVNTFIDLSIQTINEMKKNENIVDEKEKEILDFLEKQKAENEKKEKDEKNHD